MSFSLDARLQADSTPVATLALCDLRLVNDIRFPWLLLVPRRAGAVELHELTTQDRLVLIEECAAAAQALLTVAGPGKINVAALGNIVSQLHVHVVLRRRGDAAWPGPVWGQGEAEPYDPAERDARVAALARALPQ